MHFFREHLIGDHYTWNSNASFTGSPSRRLFNRSDGFQVLFIINFLASLSESFTIRDGRKMEEMIQQQLPSDIRSEMSVFNWLRGLRHGRTD